MDFIQIIHSIILALNTIVFGYFVFKVNVKLFSNSFIFEARFAKLEKSISFLVTDVKNHVINHTSLETKLLYVIKDNIEYEHNQQVANDAFKNTITHLIQVLSRIYRELRTSEEKKDRIDYKDREYIKDTVSTILSHEPLFIPIRQNVLEAVDFFITEFNQQKKEANNIVLIVDLSRSLFTLMYKLLITSVKECDKDNKSGSTINKNNSTDIKGNDNLAMNDVMSEIINVNIHKK